MAKPPTPPEPPVSTTPPPDPDPLPPNDPDPAVPGPTAPEPPPLPNGRYPLTCEPYQSINMPAGEVQVVTEDGRGWLRVEETGEPTVTRSFHVVPHGTPVPEKAAEGRQLGEFSIPAVNFTGHVFEVVRD